MFRCSDLNSNVTIAFTQKADKWRKGKKSIMMLCNDGTEQSDQLCLGKLLARLSEGTF